MSPLEFKANWKEADARLSPISLERVKYFSLLPGTMDFLTIAGLPKYAKPELYFAEDSNDFLHGINKLLDQYAYLRDYPEYEYYKYVVIGSCREGDAIAINTAENDTIEKLDHEDLFRPMFFNSSIETLAEFLILYRDFENSILSEYGKDAYNFTDLQLDNLRKKMTEIDQRAILEYGFWKGEFEIMLYMRQRYLDYKPGIDPFFEYNFNGEA